MNRVENQKLNQTAAVEFLVFNSAKGTVFFFTRISSLAIHSFKSENRVFFSSQSQKKKKKQDVFFSFRGKVHRPFIPILMKSSFFFNKSGLFFFLRIFRVFLCSFFSADKFTCHSFIQFLRLKKKKTSPGKKKKTCFIHSIEIPQKCAKTNLSG